MLRRLVIVMLVLLLPLKAAAALVLPLTGMPQHGGARMLHAIHASGQEQAAHHCEQADLADSQHSEGSAKSQHSPSASAPLECPHLAMPALAAPPGITVAAGEHAAPQATEVREPASIAIDVPSPPPTPAR
jgi:hypothetical protein